MGHRRRRIFAVIYLILFMGWMGQGCNDSPLTEDQGPGPDSGLDADLDGFPDASDVFPDDPKEWLDSDKDGVGDNGDAFPNDPSETIDTDKDGIGNNADTDDDGDGIPDTLETDKDGDGVVTATDCNDDDATVHPGAADEPDGIDVGADKNCDGMADADLAKGVVVDVVSGKDDGDGSLAKPVQTLAKAVTLAAKAKHIYLISSEKPFVVKQQLVLGPGSALYGGYYKDGEKWVRSLEKRGVIALEKGIVLKLQSTAALPEALGSVRLDTVGVTGDQTGLMTIQNVHATLLRTDVTQTKGEDAVRVIAYYGKTIADLQQSTILHKGNSAGNAVGLHGSVTVGTAAINLRGTEIAIGPAIGQVAGVKIYGKPAAATSIDFSMVDSKVSIEGGKKGWGVLLGHDGADPTPNASLVMRRAILERNVITNSLTKASFGVALHNVESAVLRNNFVTSELGTGLGKGLILAASNAVLINNTFVSPFFVLDLNPSGKKVRLMNNLFFTDPSSADIALWFDDPIAEMRHNLFSVYSAAPGFLYYFTQQTGQKGFGIGSDLAIPEAEAALNSMPFVTVNGGNRVGIPQLKDDGKSFVIWTGSAAIDAAVTDQAVTTVYDGESPDDPYVDITGKKRAMETPWDIGAFELP